MDRAEMREPVLARVADVDPHQGQHLVWHGYTVLVSAPDGSIDAERRQGLFDHDTRVLSSHHIILDGVSPRVGSSGLLEQSRWTARLIVPRSAGDARGPRLPQDALELTIGRRLGSGMIEELDVRNHSAVATPTSMTIRVDADFCDVGEVAGAPQRRGTTSCTWDDRAAVLTIDHRASHGTHDLHRAVRIRVRRTDSAPQGSDRAITFDLRLAPRGIWRAELVYEILIDGHWLSPIDSEPVLAARARIADEWQRDRAHVESDPPSFGIAVERAADDLVSLRNWEQEAGPDAWVPHAGVPSYTGLFGRDSLTAGWQAALVGPEMLRGAISRLAATQATVDSAWHDAEPGKMIHEMRRGPLSELDLIPQRGYYGTQTSSSFFVVTLSELWHWTGDTGSLRTYLDAALRALEWANRYGDRDGDGFLEYTRRSARCRRKEGWKG
jgi:glycogen debranching enzyme